LFFHLFAIHSGDQFSLLIKLNNPVRTLSWTQIRQTLPTISHEDFEIVTKFPVMPCMSDMIKDLFTLFSSEMQKK